MDENTLRKMAKARAGFKRHLFVYLFVNTFLAVLNYVMKPDYLWFLWVLSGWGLGVVLHGYFTYVGSEESLEEMEYRSLKSKFGDDKKSGE